MKKTRLTALAAALAMLSTGTGCSSVNEFLEEIFYGESSDYEIEEHESVNHKSDGSVSLDSIRSHAERLLEDVKKSGNEQAVKRDIKVLVNDIDLISEETALRNVDYYCDWLDEDLEAEYDKSFEAYYVGTELAMCAFSKGYTYEEYAPLFEEYIEEDYLDYYTDRSMSLKRVEGYSKVDCALSDEQIDKYYDIINSNESDKKKNQKAAEIYLDILSGYDTETFYDGYYRDYTPEEIMNLCKTVREEFLDVENVYSEKIWSIAGIDDAIDKPKRVKDPFKVISDFGRSISPSIGVRAESLYKKGSYNFKSGDDCYNGSFTIKLPASNDSIVYIHDDGDYYHMLTPIHEFGHYYASFYDNTHDIVSVNNLDIAEIQSQGMEMLFMNAYDDIFGNQSEAMKALKMFDMADSVVSGFAVGEFEYTALKNLDTLTPESLLELFDEIFSKYELDFNLYEINHIFESPGYYISYGVSALAALNIWMTSEDDYEKGLELYENIARVKSSSKDVRFKSALDECGFENVLEKDFIKDSAEALSDYINHTASRKEK